MKHALGGLLSHCLRVQGDHLLQFGRLSATSTQLRAVLPLSVGRSQVQLGSYVNVERVQHRLRVHPSEPVGPTAWPLAAVSGKRLFIGRHVLEAEAAVAHWTSAREAGALAMAGQAARRLDLMKDRGVDSTLTLASRVSVLSQLGMERVLSGEGRLQQLLRASEGDPEDQRLG